MLSGNIFWMFYFLQFWSVLHNLKQILVLNKFYILIKSIIYKHFFLNNS
jgi:hypothetical protein